MEGTLLWHYWMYILKYMMGALPIFGSLAAKVKFREKEKMDIAEGRGGRRGHENRMLCKPKIDEYAQLISFSFRIIIMSNT